MAMLSIESVVRGYHVYMDDWSPSVGDEFELETEEQTGTLWRSKSLAILSAVCLANSRRLYTISSRMAAEAILGR